MSEKLDSKVAVIGIDIGKNSFHIVGQDRRGDSGAAAKVVARPGGSAARQSACVPDRDGGLCRRAPPESQASGAWPQRRLMPAKYVRPYSKGEKNDYRDAEAIAEAVRWTPLLGPLAFLIGLSAVSVFASIILP